MPLEQTAAPSPQEIKQALDASGQCLPVWVRLPKQGRKGQPAEPCRISGLHRATLIDLCVKSRRNSWKPPVKSKKIQIGKSKRGIRLIHVASLLAWIDAQPDG